MATADPLYSSALNARAVKTVTTTYSAAISDCVILGDATGGSFVVTLPDATTTRGVPFIVKCISATNTVTVKSAAGTLDGTAAATGIALGTQYKAREFTSDGTNYYITAAHL